MRCTSMNNLPESISFSSGAAQNAGYILDTTNILAQVADRMYLEGIPLFAEELHGDDNSGEKKESLILQETEHFLNTVVTSSQLPDSCSTPPFLISSVTATAMESLITCGEGGDCRRMGCGVLLTEDVYVILRIPLHWRYVVEGDEKIALCRRFTNALLRCVQA